jgi:hypothetical protein
MKEGRKGGMMEVSTGLRPRLSSIAPLRGRREGFTGGKPSSSDQAAGRAGDDRCGDTFPGAVLLRTCAGGDVPRRERTIPSILREGT